jgi:hypothetical protein
MKKTGVENKTQWEQIIKETKDVIATNNNNLDIHYKQLGIEPLEVIKHNLSHEEVIGYYKATALKYLMRHPHKGAPVQDLTKCKFFIDLLIKEYEDDCPF